MAQASFSLPVEQGAALFGAANDGACDAAGLPLVLTIHADRAHVAAQLAEDARAAGFRLGAVEPLDALLGDDVRPLGDIVMVDCPVVGGAELAALVRLDERVAHAGAQLVVSTSLASLDDVFACLDQSGAQILVDPTRAERVVALGRALADHSGRSLRELAETDRMALLRLSEQVARIAERLDGLGAPALQRLDHGRLDDRRLDDGVFRFESPQPAFRHDGADLGANLGGDRLVARDGAAALPDARLVRRIIRQRQQRARFFDAGLFADPAWDMLLDLTAARGEGARVSVTSLCIASGVPCTTALRWIGQMTESGLLRRIEDKSDRRRAFIDLTDKAADAVARYFAALDQGAARLV
jgi:DNA-binding MarR family transcriptional regulator